MISKQSLNDIRVGDQLSVTELPTVGNCPFCAGDDCGKNPLEIDWEGNEQMAFSEYNCKMCGGSWELAFTYALLNILGHATSPLWEISGHSIPGRKALFYSC